MHKFHRIISRFGASHGSEMLLETYAWVLSEGVMEYRRLSQDEADRIRSMIDAADSRSEIGFETT